MTISVPIAYTLGALLVVVYAMWRIGAESALMNFGRVVIRLLTQGGIRIPTDLSESAVMGIGAVTLIAVFVSFALVASYVH